MTTIRCRDSRRTGHKCVAKHYVVNSFFSSHYPQFFALFLKMFVYVYTPIIKYIRRFHLKLSSPSPAVIYFYIIGIACKKRA